MQGVGINILVYNVQVYMYVYVPSKLLMVISFSLRSVVLYARDLLCTCIYMYMCYMCIRSPIPVPESARGVSTHFGVRSQRLRFPGVEGVAWPGVP